MRLLCPLVLSLAALIGPLEARQSAQAWGLDFVTAAGQQQRLQGAAGAPDGGLVTAQVARDPGSPPTVTELVVAKFSANGDLEWEFERTLSPDFSTLNGEPGFADLVVDSSGNVYVVHVGFPAARVREAGCAGCGALGSSDDRLRS